jgi:hypothetical protein
MTSSQGPGLCWALDGCSYVSFSLHQPLCVLPVAWQETANSTPVDSSFSSAVVVSLSAGMPVLSRVLWPVSCRQLNEALYTQPGDSSFSTMQQQPELFEQYHEGFQQQV